MPKSTYGFKYIPGAIERTISEWRSFNSALSHGALDRDAQFIPALGGCFVVLNWERNRPAIDLLNDFWEWMQAKHPILPQGRSVMVVDDDQSILKLLQIVFESAGFVVTAHGDAHSALDAIEEPGVPDVLVVDLRMAGMDGRGFVREVKAKKLVSKIIIASAFDAKSAEVELGADGSIEKPFLPEEIVELVKGLTFSRSDS